MAQLMNYLSRSSKAAKKDGQKLLKTWTLRTRRHVWQTIIELDSDSRPLKRAPLISSGDIAKEIEERRKHTPNQSSEKLIMKEYKAIIDTKEAYIFLSAPKSR
ncbi:hypothetical protein ElyMa_003857200 [Elysia marginata]|uniref:Uncharacterized protein n=1 Tax=Elysia marginata TaxID=1093978 RepID=A0AAV4FJ92_9GAST|nr:hypothetical protein ElyMa_003857200 [Elysia marginata]